MTCLSRSQSAISYGTQISNYKDTVDDFLGAAWDLEHILVFRKYLFSNRI